MDLMGKNQKKAHIETLEKDDVDKDLENNILGM